MVNPARDTTAGRVYNDLRNSARRDKRSTDEVMVEYVLERLLYRLATSLAGGKHFDLEREQRARDPPQGGLLLAQFGARRIQPGRMRRASRGGEVDDDGTKDSFVEAHEQNFRVSDDFTDVSA